MMGNTFFFDWEVAFMQSLQSAGGSVGKYLASFFTLFGQDAMMLAIIGIFYWGISKKMGKFISLNFVAGLLTGCVLKNIARRRRPYMDHETIQCLKPATKGADPNDVMAQGFSFPSLHANDSVTIYGSIFTLVKKNWFRVLLAVLIPCIGLSRIILGVHYPTDVLVGWLDGILVVTLMSFIQRKGISVNVISLGMAVLAIPGWLFCVSDDFFTGYGLLLGMFLAYLVEEKFVNFENTRSIPRVILRTVGGVAIFAILAEVLKLPFPRELREGITFIAHLIRCFRYAISIFVALAIYPMCFKREMK